MSCLLVFSTIQPKAQIQHKPERQIPPRSTDLAHEISERLSTKVELRQGQKDRIFTTLKSYFLDFESNKVIATPDFIYALKKVRDSNIENILLDINNYEGYLIIIEEFDHYQPQNKSGYKPPFDPSRLKKKRPKAEKSPQFNQ